MSMSVKDTLFESAESDGNTGSDLVKVKFTNGDSYFTKEQYLLYRQKIDRANKFYKKRAEKERTTPCQNKRSLQILYTIYNREFESIAKNKSYSEKIPSFKEIRITDEAYKKANLIAKRMYAISGDNEIYLHLLNSIQKRKGEDFVIIDVYIPGGQEVTSVNCSLKNPIEKMNDAKEILGKGEYISGWAHSHARMHTFHSGTDNNNLLTEVLNGTTLKIAPNPFGTQKVNEYSFRFFPSLVFNALGDLPSCAIAIDYPYFVLGKGLTMKTHINFSPKLKINDEINNINLNPRKVDYEIRTKVLPYNPKLNISLRDKWQKSRYKTPLEKSIPKTKNQGDSSEKKISSYRVFKRLNELERQYEDVYNKVVLLEKENRTLKKRVKTLEDMVEDEE